MKNELAPRLPKYTLQLSHDSPLTTAQIEACRGMSRMSLQVSIALNSTYGARDNLWDNLNRGIHYREAGGIVSFPRAEGTDCLSS